MIPTIIISLLLAAIVIRIIVYMVRKNKKGHGSCNCGCDSCGLSGTCHRDK